MPALTAAPTILVFPSSGKISGAKVKKYTTASEKGLNVYEDGWAVPLTGVDSPALKGSPFAPPSSKRQRPLFGSTASPAATGATFAPPKRKKIKAVRKIDLDQDMYFEDGITSLQEPEWLSEDDSAPPPPSDTSSLTPVPPSDKEPSPFRDPTPEDHDYGKFASYYIQSDETDNVKKTAAAPPVKAPKPAKQPPPTRQPPQQPPQPQPTGFPQPQPQPQKPYQRRAPRAPRTQQSSSRATPAQPPPPPQPLSQPMPPTRLHIVDDIQVNRNLGKKITVDDMVTRLDVLSLALTQFGGAPPSQVAQIRAIEARRRNATSANANAAPPQPATTQRTDEPVNDLLAMFDDDDKDSDLTEDDDDVVILGIAEANKTVESPISNSGILDADLSYGIEFIMNALKTWARQKVESMNNNSWQRYQEALRQYHHQQQLAQPKRPRGRPRKDDDQRTFSLGQQPAPAHADVGLTHYPEGQAVQAFQDVVDCGLLKVNAVMPAQLADGLGTLYVQIDHLINNNSRNEPPWQCMSYNAQIKAQEVKVQRWKEQVARMQGKILAQPDMSQQAMTLQLANMGLATHMPHRGSMSRGPAGGVEVIDLEQDYGRHGARQQQHTSRQSQPTHADVDRSRPGSVTVPPSAGPFGSGSSRRASNAMQGASRNAGPSNGPRDPMADVVTYHDSQTPGVNPEYHSRLQMRSGQGMKFSFDHPNETARVLFGSEAFPSAADQASNVPRRGPMDRTPNASTPTTLNGGRTNGAAHTTPVLGSNAPPHGHPVAPGQAVKVTSSEAAASAASPSAVDAEMGGVESVGAQTNGRHQSNPELANNTTMASGKKRKYDDDMAMDGVEAAASPVPPQGEKKERSKIKLKLKGRGSSSASGGSAVTSPTESAGGLDEVV